MNALWTKFNNWCANSGTIIWSRIKTFVGIVWTVLASQDLSVILNPKWLLYWMVFDGIVSELIRRSGTETKTAQLGGTQVTYLADKPPST